MLDTMNGSYYLGRGKFLPGLKKIGKFTSQYTTTIAKAFLPASLVNAASSFDPTKKALSNMKKSAAELLQPTPQPVKSTKPKAKLPLAAVGIGAAVLGGLLLLKKRR